VKVGDIVKYGYSRTGVILYVNEPGGTLKVLDKFGKIDWFVTSYCEVISESR